ncbi:MAG: 3-oxoacyl-ACP reductase [Chloroflexi bacterium]|nr:SDR family oxidoreductase [Chloroflexota bacterium]RUA24941.1 MAG: 3-oxoacyl-ACP reductase [Chloroflexota bacterium]HIM49899.1 SDR family oxidoreductase [Dehalococcoidia bacterium]
MDLGLKGRVAVVGGGSRGLGKACALSLAREGANVAICSRGVESLEAAAKEIRSTTGAEVLAVPADLSRLADIRDLLQKTVDHFGRLDVVVCNSGGPPEGRAVDTSEETWDQAIQMALTFFIRMGREAVPHLKNRSWGRIVNILASTVYQPIDNLVTSGVTRMGAVAFAKSLADEVGRDNILVNNVAPGFLLTDRMVGLFETRASETGESADTLLQARASAIPMGRFGRPEELADLVAFLASEKNGYITGTTILVDGGVVRSVL